MPVSMSDSELRERFGSRPDLADVAAYGAPQLDVAVRLNTNESPYPPPKDFMEDLGRSVANLGLNRYPDRDFPALREGLARHVGTLTERIWVANGSNEIIQQLVQAFGGSERKAMTFEPTYAMHSHITRVSGTRFIRARRNPDFTMDLEASLSAIGLSQPEIIFLCSPNNPTGTVIPDEDVAAICDAAPGLVILDEAYAEFSGGSLWRLVEDYEHLVVVRTFSKAWRMAGARIGYMVAQGSVGRGPHGPCPRRGVDGHGRDDPPRAGPVVERAVHNPGHHRLPEPRQLHPVPVRVGAGPRGLAPTAGARGARPRLLLDPGL